MGVLKPTIEFSFDKIAQRILGMAESTVFTDEELEKMLANFEWHSDEDSGEVEESYNVLPRSINTKVT